VQADRVERLCVSVSRWLVQINTSAQLRNAVLSHPCIAAIYGSKNRT